MWLVLCKQKCQPFTWGALHLSRGHDVHLYCNLHVNLHQDLFRTEVYVGIDHISYKNKYQCSLNFCFAVWVKWAEEICKPKGKLCRTQFPNWFRNSSNSIGIPEWNSQYSESTNPEPTYANAIIAVTLGPGRPLPTCPTSAEMWSCWEQSFSVCVA